MHLDTNDSVGNSNNVDVDNADNADVGIRAETPDDMGVSGVGVKPLLSQSFAFRFGAYSTQAIMEGCDESAALTLVRGVQKQRICVADIAYFFVDSSDNETVLVLALKTGRKAKVIRVSSNPSDKGFLDLVQTLSTMRPASDLRGWKKREAYKRMGLRWIHPVAIWLVLAGVPALVGCALAPQLVHGLDFGLQPISLNQFTKKTPMSSRNVIVTEARAALDEAVEVTRASYLALPFRSGNEVSYLIPLVAPRWNKQTPVGVILLTDDMDAQQDEYLQQTTEFRGIVRNVLWEGVSAKDRAYLEQKAGIKLVGDVMLVQHMANPRYDLLLFCVGVGISFAAALLVTIGVRLRQRQ